MLRLKIDTADKMDFIQIILDTCDFCGKSDVPCIEFSIRICRQCCFKFFHKFLYVNNEELKDVTNED